MNYLKCSDEEDMVHRIRRRAIRENRTDDANEDIIRRRFDIYREVTAPVLAAVRSGHHSRGEVQTVHRLKCCTQFWTV